MFLVLHIKSGVGEMSLRPPYGLWLCKFKEPIILPCGEKAIITPLSTVNCENLFGIVSLRKIKKFVIQGFISGFTHFREKIICKNEEIANLTFNGRVDPSLNVGLQTAKEFLLFGIQLGF